MGSDGYEFLHAGDPCLVSWTNKIRRRLIRWFNLFHRVSLAVTMPVVFENEAFQRAGSRIFFFFLFSFEWRGEK